MVIKWNFNMNLWVWGMCLSVAVVTVVTSPTFASSDPCVMSDGLLQGDGLIFMTNDQCDMYSITGGVYYIEGPPTGSINILDTQLTLSDGMVITDNYTIHPEAKFHSDRRNA
jgi:hypothetical protein